MNESIEMLRMSQNYILNETTANYSLEASFIHHENETNYVPYERRLETYLVPIIFLFIFVVGLIGNGTVVCIYFRHKYMRTVPNTYIISLAIGDLIIIVVALPFVSTIYTFESWPYGEMVCKISEFSRDISIGVTVFTLTMLSAERYAAIIQPMKYISNQNKTLTFNVIIWSISTIMAIPGVYNSFVWKVFITDDKYIFVCYPFPQELGDWYPKTIVFLKFLLYYAIPLMMISTFYTLIARHLTKSAKNPVGNNETHYKQLRGRKKISKVVLGLVVIFAICFFPNQVFMLWYYYHPHANELYNNFWHVWRIMGFVLTFLNSCLNPVVLCIISGVFRTHFKHYILWCFHKEIRRDQSGILLGLRSGNSIDCQSAKLNQTPAATIV